MGRGRGGAGRPARDRNTFSGDFGEYTVVPMVATQGRYAGQTRYHIYMGRGESRIVSDLKEARQIARDLASGAIRRGTPRSTRGGYMNAEENMFATGRPGIGFN